MDHITLKLNVVKTLLFLAFLLSVIISAAAITPEEYLKTKAGPGAKIFGPGQLILSGKKMSCGRRHTVYDSNFDDIGGAYPNFIILNPKKMKGLPRSVKFYVYAHECGHQFRGISEEEADCFAVKRGRRQGWLNKRGLKQICNFVRPFAGSRMHPPGPERCEIMKKCFNNVVRR